MAYTSHVTRRPFPWLALLGAVVFLGPGFITWSFAEHEAMRIASDWFYISTPLLLVGFVCLGLALHRFLGMTGVIIGVVVGVATLGGLTFVLSGSIDERVEYRAQLRRLDLTEAFCTGVGAAQPDAMPYTPGAPNTMVTYSGSGQVMRDEFGAPFRDWRPETPRVDQTALVGCIVDIRSEIETCQYDGGRMLHRVRVDRAVRVFSLQTGQLVGETLLAGGMPDGCHSLEEFYGSGDNTRAGTVPSDEDVVAYLRPLIGR